VAFEVEGKRRGGEQREEKKRKGMHDGAIVLLVKATVAIYAVALRRQAGIAPVQTETGVNANWPLDAC
jgi:hypothetical protein